MKRLAAVTLTLSFLITSTVGAFSVRSIFAEQAQGISGETVTLKVSPGQGLNINFIPTGETIKKAWLDDPSRIALSFDGTLCQSSTTNDSQQTNCNNEGATVIHLRQIKSIDFPNLPRSSDGSTLLTLVAQGANGRKLYQFKVVPISSESEYTTIAIKPDSENSNPEFSRTPDENNDTQRQTQTRVPIRQLAATMLSPQPAVPTPTMVTLPALKMPPSASQSASYINSNDLAPTHQKTASSEMSSNRTGSGHPLATESRKFLTNDANAAAYGLLLATDKGLVLPNSKTWHKAQGAIWLLRLGKSKEEAARFVDMQESVLTQLIALGQ